jgi:hypothetical protein
MVDSDDLELSIRVAKSKQINLYRWRRLSTLFAFVATAGSLLAFAAVYYGQIRAGQMLTFQAERIEQLRAELDRLPPRPPISLTVIVGDPVNRFAPDPSSTSTDRVLTVGCDYLALDEVSQLASQQAPKGTRFDRLTILSSMPGGRCGFSVFTATYLPTDDKPPTTVPRYDFGDK